MLAVGDIHIENFGTWRNVEAASGLGYQRFRRSGAHALRVRPGPPRHQRAACAGMKVRPKTIARSRARRLSARPRRPASDVARSARDMDERIRRHDRGGAQGVPRRNGRVKDEEGVDHEQVPDAQGDGMLEAAAEGPASRRLQRARPASAASAVRASSRSPNGAGGSSSARQRRRCPRPGTGRTARPDAESRLHRSGPKLHPARPIRYLEADGHFVFRRLAADADKIECRQIWTSRRRCKQACSKPWASTSARSTAAIATTPTRDQARICETRADGNWLHKAADGRKSRCWTDFNEWTEAECEEAKEEVMLVARMKQKRNTMR